MKTQNWLRIEALMALAVIMFIMFKDFNFHWTWILILLIPDLSMIAYAAGPKMGAWVYNLAHTYAIPVGLILFLNIDYLYIQMLGYYVPNGATLWLYLWIAHIALDRALGYGLKDVAGFAYTHMGQIGKKR